MLYGPVDTLNKEGYLSYVDNIQKSIEGQISLLDIQDSDSTIRTEEQRYSITELPLEISPLICQKLTYRFANNKVLSITVDSINSEEHMRSFTEKWIPFAFYIKDQYGIEDVNEIIANIKKYLSDYTSLSALDK